MVLTVPTLSLLISLHLGHVGLPGTAFLLFELSTLLLLVAEQTRAVTA